MGLFSKNSDSEALDDAALIKAARKRILAELEAKQASGGTTINNNVSGGSGGLMERMNGGGQAGDGGDLRDYLVDIERRDLPEINEATGKPAGWTKKVHRYVQEKKK